MSDSLVFEWAAIYITTVGMINYKCYQVRISDHLCFNELKLVHILLTDSLCISFLFVESLSIMFACVAASVYNFRGQFCVPFILTAYVYVLWVTTDIPQVC